MIRRRFTITLAAEADRDPDAAIRKLRALLKHVGRCYRLRCESVRELTDAPDDPRSPESET